MEREVNRECKDNVTIGLNESPVKSTIENFGTERYNTTTLNEVNKEEMQEFLKAISIGLLYYHHKEEEKKND